MEITIRKGTFGDLDELERLYNELIDDLESHVNYPGWEKDIYPTRRDAQTGIEEDCLFVACAGQCIVGTIILRQQQEAAYDQIDWQIKLEDRELLVIYTFAVHPAYLGQKIGSQLMAYAISYAQLKQLKAIRLDVYEFNLPAIHLYERFGFSHMGTVDLGYSEYGLDNFYLYQNLL